MKIAAVVLSSLVLCSCAGSCFQVFRESDKVRRASPMLKRAIDMAMLDKDLHMKAFDKEVLMDEVAVYSCEGQCGDDLIWRIASLCKRKGESIDDTVREYISYSFRNRPGIGKNYYGALDEIQFGAAINYVLVCCDEDPRAVRADLVQAHGFRQHGIESVVGVCITDTAAQAAVWTR